MDPTPPDFISKDILSDSLSGGSIWN